MRRTAAAKTHKEHKITKPPKGPPPPAAAGTRRRSGVYSKQATQAPPGDHKGRRSITPGAGPADCVDRPQGAVWRLTSRSRREGAARARGPWEWGKLLVRRRTLARLGPCFAAGRRAWAWAWASFA
jgi:hypothetical protein